MENDICSEIIEKYYRSIYAYCFTQLNYSNFSADDCTQEVFLLMIKKRKKLDFSDNIKLWLYRTADNVIRNYKRKNRNLADIDVDSLEIPVENDFEITSDNSSGVLDKLSDEELRLVQAYYGAGQGDKEEVAKKFGLNLRQLYKTIHKIKLKLRE